MTHAVTPMPSDTVEHCAVGSNARAVRIETEPDGRRDALPVPTERGAQSMSPYRKSLTAAALLVAMSSAAHAYDFFSAVSQSQDGSTMYCAIVNVGATPAVVSAKVLNMIDGSDITAR